MEDQVIYRLFDDSREVVRLARDHLSDRIPQAVKIIVESYRSRGCVFSFGNGGSAADAQHIACELVGRFLIDRAPLRAQALTVNTSSLTSIANDYDYESVFARQIEAMGTKGDVAIGISTSGNSANVVEGLRKAREIGMRTIGLTGDGGGKCSELSDVLLDVPSNQTPRIQEAHEVIYHIICELVEAEIFGDG